MQHGTLAYRALEAHFSHLEGWGARGAGFAGKLPCPRSFPLRALPSPSTWPTHGIAACCLTGRCRKTWSRRICRPRRGLDPARARDSSMQLVTSSPLSLLAAPVRRRLTTVCSDRRWQAVLAQRLSFSRRPSPPVSPALTGSGQSPFALSAPSVKPSVRRHTALTSGRQSTTLAP